MSQDITEALRASLGDSLLTDPADCHTYGYDNSKLQGQPMAVALPTTHEQVVAVVRACYEHDTPLLARGQGTGTTGATVPLDRQSVIISMHRMNRLIELDRDNRLVVVEPGITNQQVQQTAAGQGFFWPPDPTSAAVCTVGGNLAYNSAGPRAVKYGTPRENTLGLCIVTGDGRTLRTGVRTTKGVVGYDLTRLMIGSEGTLGIITEATLKLTPLQPAKRTLRAEYRDMHSAAKAVANIMASPVTPCALEFMDGNAIDMVRDELAGRLASDTGALLIIEVDGLASQIDELAEQVSDSAKTTGCLAVHQASNEAEVAALWDVRKALSPALRRVAPKKINEDVVVPVSCIPVLVDRLSEFSKTHGIHIVNFGHAGNGNLHVNLLYNPDDAGQQKRAEACLEDVFSTVLELGGTLSGEHGIGLVKRDWVAKEIGPDSLQLMHAIKRQFDPKGILNPGKALPPID
ncbi:D-lactate dehydrogenase [Thiogranum longum]|uniref:D-lactate dehydrogenase n=1 Tax=Thiogranum longum TaxID=1537524 RepID=A0A4R1HFF3_9GAMM|nr:FAD-linked oxidase C-terminal domain-containing protein [Thiogranum longum]TCK19065.1 D-lactate dehydrogenase [Thiogranum longum]